MKANKAPEKIYLTKNLLGELRDGWDALPAETFISIEYTRTDAFIKMACEKLEKCMYDNLMFQGRLHRKEVIETFIEDFKKHLEEQV
jgi:hypothetical protein